MSDRSESSSLISSKWKKYQNYDVNVDARQDDRSTEIQMLSLLPEIHKTLGLSKKEIWTSSIAGVGGTILVRFLLGPLCDMYGARTLFAMVLCLAAVPTALTGLVRSANDLAILRFFIGIAGGSFVMCQYWMGIMFSKEVVGSANAIVSVSVHRTVFP
jgi:MFS transporter, NNP family, nitrate/nitrite transporter